MMAAPSGRASEKDSRHQSPMPGWEIVENESDVDISKIDPCPKCRSRRRWWNVFGKPFCLSCNPPATSIRLLKIKKKFVDARDSHQK